MPDTNDDDEDDETFLGRSIYKKQRSPKNIEEYLVLDEDNMLHFKALAKHYGVNQYLVTMPESAEKAQEAKYTVPTPEAHVQSLSATQRDKDMFIKFLVEQLR